MRFIPDEQIKSMTEGGKKNWYNSQMEYSSGHYYPEIQRPFVFRCLKCQSNFMIDGCANCDSPHFQVGSSGGWLGLFCGACEKGFTSWSCTKCGSDNPASRTYYYLHKVPGGCFIATAACGSENHPDVVLLREYRDKFLYHSKLGKQFIALYYTISPTIARLISKCLLLRKIVRIVFIQPIAGLCRRFITQEDDTLHE